MTDHVRLFLIDYRKWAELDAPVTNRWGFKRTRALCSNLTFWCHALHLQEWERRNASKDLEHMLLITLGDADYPFGGHMQHDRECRTETIHGNPDRLAWINKMIENLSSI